jgi:4-aminobutyrate aminotransferase-like enzyme
MQQKENKDNRIKFSTEDIKTLVKKLYGFTVEVKPLDSERDWNFLVTDETGKRFVFKIANAEEEQAILEAQNQTLEHIADNNPGVKCPRVCHTVSGAAISDIQSSAGTTLLVRMLNYLPGTFLGHMDAGSHSPELLENIGRFMGSLDKTLASFYHPALTRYLNWDLKTTPDMEDQLDHFSDVQERNLVHHFILQYNTEVAPRLHKLRISTIHNDANDYNLLIADNGKDIAGLIDFGDMVHSYTINELAVAITYAIHGKKDLLETAALIVKGYHKEYPLTEPELEVLYYLIGARLCKTLVISSRELHEEPDNEYLGISLAPARKALHTLVTINPDQAMERFRRACGLPPQPKGKDPQTLLRLRDRRLGKSLSVSYKTPLKIVRGYMQYLYDHTGRAYLDTVNNVCHVGHCHPRVVKAAKQQIAALNTNTRYLHDNIVEYALELTATLPDPLSVCFFVCTGSEANELALRMARTHTGKHDFVVVDHAYHGNTNGIIEISAYKFDGPGGKGKPDHVHKTPLPDPYRGIYKGYNPETGEKYAAHVRQVFKDVIDNGRQAAAYIHESVPGVAGQVVFPAGYLEHAYAFARQTGAVCIADEVQIGFGRVGSHMWGFQTQGVIPDIVTMGKPIGNGHPLAAVVTTREIAESFDNGMEYFNTFGGNPVSCAIGREVLNVIQEEKLLENAHTTGQYMKNGLEELKDKHPLIGDVRGLGLFIGIELVTCRDTLTPAKDEAYHIAERMKENGILISVDGPLHNVLKIKPPIVFSKANAQQYIETLDTILTKEFPS